MSATKTVSAAAEKKEAELAKNFATAKKMIGKKITCDKDVKLYCFKCKDHVDGNGLVLKHGNEKKPENRSLRIAGKCSVCKTGVQRMISAKDVVDKCKQA